MFIRLLHHEWRALRADATIWLIGGVFAVVIGYAMTNGVRWVTFQQAALRVAAAEETERYERLKAQVSDLRRPGAQVSPFADPRSPTVVGGRLGPRYAMLPPGPLAPLAIGQSDLLPYYVKVSTDARETIIAAAEIENPQRLLVGRFDLAFVLVFLYPLLILAVTYNMLSAEKEQGTLALALSQPLSLGTLVTGKVTLRALMLIGVVVSFSLVALLAGGTNLAAPGAAVRMALWVTAVAAYGALWFSLAVLVASLGRASAANATILATLWLVLVVMLPSLFNLVATTMYPVPSRVEMIQAVRVASDEATGAGSTLLARYYEDHPELATGGAEQAMNDFNVIRVAVDDDVARRVRPVVARYEQQIDAQQRIMERLRFLSPAVLMQDALNDIAGTGTPRHRHFLDQVDHFHAQWRGFFVPLIVQKAQIASFDHVPRFTYREEATTDVARRILVGLLGLTAPAVCVAVLGLRRLRRYPIVS
jgi:ABC-2 type transport system permease protein